MIDLFFTNKPENILQSGMIHLGISDHSLIYAVRKFNSPKCRERLKLVRNFKNFTWPEIQDICTEHVRTLKNKMAETLL
jgi:hypothetical protein